MEASSHVNQGRLTNKGTMDVWTECGEGGFSVYPWTRELQVGLDISAFVASLIAIATSC